MVGVVGPMLRRRMIEFLLLLSGDMVISNHIHTISVLNILEHIFFHQLQHTLCIDLKYSPSEDMKELL